MEFSRPLIGVDQLASLLDRQEVVIIDCRFSLADPGAGRRAYREAHLPGAVYFHLDDDLSGPVGPHGGRHPLPHPEVLASKLSAAGVSSGVQVVAYDENGAMAARFWWLLRWLGHDEVAVLDGGYNAWVAAGGQVTPVVPNTAALPFTPRPRREMIAKMDEVRQRPAACVAVDGRSSQRFAGEYDPLDEKQGHIPGAINRFWGDSLGPNGFWRSPAEQRDRFANLPEGADVIHYCGSGVTACANLLAMEMAGLTGSRLYAGSWSDWCSYAANPVEK